MKRNLYYKQAIREYNKGLLENLDQMDANWNSALNAIDAGWGEYDGGSAAGGDGGGGAGAGGGGGAGGEYSYDNSSGNIPTGADNVQGTNTVTPTGNTNSPTTATIPEGTPGYSYNPADYAINTDNINTSNPINPDNTTPYTGPYSDQENGINTQVEGTIFETTIPVLGGTIINIITITQSASTNGGPAITFNGGGISQFNYTTPSGNTTFSMPSNGEGFQETILNNGGASSFSIGISDQGFSTSFASIYGNTTLTNSFIYQPYGWLVLPYMTNFMWDMEFVK
jgi:hypothetical protein